MELQGPSLGSLWVTHSCCTFSEGERENLSGSGPQDTTHSVASLECRQLASWRFSNPDDMIPLVASSNKREDFSGARRGLWKETLPSVLLGTTRTSLWDVEASSMWDPGRGAPQPFRGWTNFPLPLSHPSHFAAGDDVVDRASLSEDKAVPLVPILFTWLSPDPHPKY